MERLGLRAWIVTVWDIHSGYIATSRSKAKYLCAIALVETGYCRNCGEAFKEIKRCVRAPDLDWWSDRSKWKHDYIPSHEVDVYIKLRAIAEG